LPVLRLNTKHGTTRHFFCPHCMSRMFTRPDGFDFVNLRATMLDDPSGFVPDYASASQLGEVSASRRI
jgi:hypothetical protein